MSEFRTLLVGAAVLGTVACSERPVLTVGAPGPGPFGAGLQSADPGLAVDPSTGDLLAVWTAGDGEGWQLFFARSADGTAWSVPVPVAGGPGAMTPQGESSPRLAGGPDGRLAVAWPDHVRVEGRKWPVTMMQLARSDDGGRSWAPPVTLNDDTTGAPASHQFHGIAWAGDSALLVAWLDERPGAALAAHHGDDDTSADRSDEPDAAIFLARSPDFGRTWAPANQPLWGQVCPCCRVSLARGPDGSVLSAWRRHFPGNVRDVVTAPVGGEAVSAPTRVNPDNWVYPGCPHTGPAVAVDANHGTHVAWFSGVEGAAGIWYHRTGPDGTAWRSASPVALVTARTLPASHASVAATPDGGALVVFDVTAAGERAIQAARLGPDGSLLGIVPVPESAGGSYPQILVTGPGRAVVAWTAGGDRRQARMVELRFPAGPSDPAARSASADAR